MAGYQCIICKESIAETEMVQHGLDPCALVIVGHVNREWKDQKEQTFYCHFQCFRRIVNDDGLLYVAEPDFCTNGAVQDDG